MSTAKKVKGFKKSKPGTYLQIGTSLFGAVSVIKQLRTARSEGDKLKLIDAVVGATAIVTGVALLVRDLRRLDSGDVLAD
ncbi:MULTISPECIES: hypothetical protein [Streptomyces]|uniref:DUF4235 domain-containing protein n=1 Tax=Streptomyces silvisoli TaxID=3034235 RepID=A0ABT5ZHI0_9ACTN|nr:MULTISPECIES: hypothetical protein [Streptomyces]MDF3289279.1 hypothetical protein [Streptomyces silvisoli]